MPSACRGGTETYWRRWGTGAPTLLLLHCTLAHSGAWGALAGLLDQTAVAFDLPGHGRSGPRNPDQDYQTQCLDVARDFIGAGPMDVIGHSFGATVALRLAAEQPDHVRRLVLIEPVFFAAARGTVAFAEHMKTNAPFDVAMRSGDRHRAAQIFTDMWGTGVAWADMRADQQQVLTRQIDIIPAQNGALFDDNAGLLAPGRLEAVNAPVLLLEGSASPPVINAISKALERRLPNANRQIIGDAGHMLPITHPGEAAAAIEPFLSF